MLRCRDQLLWRFFKMIAEHCWTKCCCRSPKQRADWAKANGVSPPSYAIVTETAPVVASKSPACFSKKIETPIAKSCCEGRSESGKKDLKNESMKVVSNSAKKASPRLSIQLTLTALVIKCHGQSSDFALMPWTTLVKPMSLGLNLPSIDTLGLPEDQQPLYIYYDPAVPPPRRVS